MLLTISWLQQHNTSSAFFINYFDFRFNKRRIKFYSLVFSVTSRLLVINITWSSVSREQQTTPRVANLPRSGAAVCITLDGRTVDNTRWNRISAENRNFPTPPAFEPPLGGFRRIIAVRFNTEKLEWCGYPMMASVVIWVVRSPTQCLKLNCRKSRVGHWRGVKGREWGWGSLEGQRPPSGD